MAIRSWSKARKLDLRLQAINNCYDIVESGIFHDGEHMTEGQLLHMAIGCMNKESKEKFVRKTDRLLED